jgi:hypothetical protein
MAWVHQIGHDYVLGMSAKNFVGQDQPFVRLIEKKGGGELGARVISNPASGYK